MNPKAHMQPDIPKTQFILHWLWRWLPPMLWMGGIFYLSSQPSLPHAPDPWLDVLIKKSGHVSEYAILFLLFARAWHTARCTRARLDLSWLATTAFALSDELHQSFVPGRHCQWSDVIIDVSGALLLWLLLRNGLWSRLLSTRDNDHAK
jgi:VanZ family protein